MIMRVGNTLTVNKDNFVKLLFFFSFIYSRFLIFEISKNDTHCETEEVYT